MIYSGADLIRNAGQLAERLERSAPADSVRAASDSAPHHHLDDETQNALVRFARFLNKDKAPPKKKAAVSQTKSANPYAQAEERENTRESLGHTLDIYV